MLPNDIDGLHIELTNLCTLKCPACPRTQLIKKWPRHWKNYNLDLDNLTKFLDIDLQNKVVTLCGNTGDPIYHPEFHSFVEYFKQHGAVLRIITNGSYRSEEWWNKTVSYLDSADTVVFSVDGLPENFAQYRINADWESIHTAMKICVQAPCRTLWKYIVFSFNENNIADAESLSKQIGIDVFTIDKSSRFDHQNLTGVDHQLISFMPTSDSYVDPRYQNQLARKNINGSLGINPVCKDKKSHYISANGYYSPCCFIADMTFYYKTVFGKNKKMYDISTRSLTELFQQQELNEFNADLANHSVCQFSCPTNASHSLVY